MQQCAMSTRLNASRLAVQEGKLAASEELGDLFKGASDWDTAQAIYQASGASGKVVEALAAKGDFDQLVRDRGTRVHQASACRNLGSIVPLCGPTSARGLATELMYLASTPSVSAVCRRSTHGPAVPPPTICSCFNASAWTTRTLRSTWLKWWPDRCGSSLAALPACRSLSLAATATSVSPG